MEKGTEGLVAIASKIRPDLGYVLIESKDFNSSQHTLFDPNPPAQKPPPEVNSVEEVKEVKPKPNKKEVIGDAG